MLKPTDKVSDAHADASCGILQQESLGEILVHPFLGTGDGVVGMVGLQRNDGEPGLPGARRFNEQRFGGLHGDLVAAESLDKVNAEVQRRVDSATAIKPA